MFRARECIKNARYKLGLNQREFAEMLDISKASVSLYENGDRQPSFPAIRKIVDRLRQHNINLEYSDLRDR
jgi:transcriptional regulator with XRE-family HTH domain